jgi:N-carbamoylputrescine amidase
MRPLTVAATQFACTWDLPANADRAEGLVRKAAGQGAQVVLIQELFAAPYFCIEQHPKYFSLAQPLEGNPLVARFASLARELGVVIPVSVFERAGPAFFNTVVVVDADGQVVGVYRKSHIPQGPGYEEKYYFSPGDTGFRVWETAFGRLGVGICWDQWFPECARAMALMGAEVLLYPPPSAPSGQSRLHPAMTANRTGKWCSGVTQRQTWYRLWLRTGSGRKWRRTDVK